VDLFTTPSLGNFEWNKLAGYLCRKKDDSGSSYYLLGIYVDGTMPGIYLNLISQESCNKYLHPHFIDGNPEIKRSY
jgi:hypothetical protein